MSETNSSIALGSGSADLQGTVINYEYDGFGGFYLKIQGNTVKWQGFVGVFKGITRVMYPIASKVADGIYFLSWETHPGNGDNVVYNFNDNTVFGHLGGEFDIFSMISGDIHCCNELGCIEPEGEAMDIETVMELLLSNSEKAGMTLEQALAGKAGPADEEAKRQLSGKTLQYQTEGGVVRVSVDNENTVVKTTDSPTKSYMTHATLIAEGIYFLSWGGEHSGNHIVFNSHSMKVYKQIMPDGSRQESIYEVISFTNSKN